MKKLRVSDLAKYAFCSKRSKLESTRESRQGRISKAMKKGSKMHKKYSIPYKSFNRRVLRYKLRFPRVYERVIKRDKLLPLLIRGIPDDLEINSGKVTIVEVKTTSKKRLWVNEEQVAILQCQIYMWLLEPYLIELGYELGGGLVEIYSQKDNSLLKRIIVNSLLNTEEVIKDIFNSWIGLSKMYYPPKYICKRCPRNIRERCDRWIYYNSLKR